MSIIASMGLDSVFQDDLLVREFRDALFPQILFRAEAKPEKWDAQVGETAIYTRRGLLTPTVDPLTPGTDPTPKLPSFEQWSVSCFQYGDAMDVHMPTSRTALASLFANNMQALGLQAGQSINRVSRNKLFQAYLGGDTVTQAAASSTSVSVASLNGFTHVVVQGAVVPVSASNTKAITISGVGSRLVTAATPTNPLIPYGPGTLTVSVSANYAANARVLAADAPYIMRAGGATTVDGLTSLSKVTMADVRKMVSLMRRNRVPTHPDGLYHLHLDPLVEAELFSDNELQRMIQSLPEHSMWKGLAIGVAHGVMFISNNESPSIYNSGTLASSRSADADALYSPEYFAEVRNASGIGITRSIMTGGGSIIEKFVDEGEYTSEAGITGKVGSWSITNNGASVPVERIRMIMRAPQDRLQQMVSLAWSFSGDWGIPTDLLGGQTGGRYKRAMVLESGSDE